MTHSNDTDTVDYTPEGTPSTMFTIVLVYKDGSTTGLDRPLTLNNACQRASMLKEKYAATVASVQVLHEDGHEAARFNNLR